MPLNKETKPNQTKKNNDVIKSYNKRREIIM